MRMWRHRHPLRLLPLHRHQFRLVVDLSLFLRAGPLSKPVLRAENHKTSHYAESKELVTRMRQHLRHLTLLVVTRPTQKTSLQRTEKACKHRGRKEASSLDQTFQHLEIVFRYTAFMHIRLIQYAIGV